MCGRVVGTDVDRRNADKLTQVLRWFEDWEQETRTARKAAEQDRDYYDGLQWSDSDKADVEERGQAAIVKNRIFKKINFLLGMEVRNRADPKAFPRTPAHDEDVLASTDGIRYVCDSEDFDKKSSGTWGNELIEGYGGCVVEHEIVTDKNTGEKRVEVRVRGVKWDRLWYDLHSREHDFSDATHRGISYWADLNDHIRNYGKKAGVASNYADVLREAFVSGGNQAGDETHEDKPETIWSSTEGGRQRLRVSECFYLDEKVDESGESTGEVCWYFCAYTKAGFVVPPRPTGYVDEHGHDVCPLEMVSAFVTRKGVRYGLVRHMIGPQDEVNKRSSKYLHLLSVRQFAFEDGAFPDETEASIQMAKPDGKIRVNRGALADNRFQLLPTADMAQGQFNLYQEAKADIDSIGPDVPNLAAMPAAASGRARQMALQIGSLELTPVEDNHKRWKRAVYRQIWWRIRQFWPEEKWLRVRDDAERSGFRFVALNRRMTRGERFMELLKKEVPMESAASSVLGNDAPLVVQQAGQMHQAMMQQMGPQAQQIPPDQMQQHMTQLLMRHPKMQEEFTANEVAQLDVDIVLDESPDTTILQQEEAEQLREVIQSIIATGAPDPSMVKFLLELLVEALQLRSKRKILEMMRKAPDPQRAQMQQMMQQLQQRQAQAGVAVTESQAQLNQAKAAQATADAQVTAPQAAADVEAKKAQAMKDAAAAGEKMGGPAVPV